ncbi:MAG: hypothetical protein CL840_20400 [Crocinitomicaceae bacterium]|nr:hypothetical protein [Crocinitomicaceae bacterium]|tara:strand:- start:19763 stop:20038 length:276 start_codon:yes stop_codon:yes gene_type:complete
MIEKLIAFFQKPREKTSQEAPKGFCPNCWGEQEYDQQIRDLQRDMQIDVNNHRANYAFIQDFVVNRIDGIKLKKGNNGYECPVCRTKYPGE